MSVKPAKVQFNGGELSPWLEGRTDIAKYDKTAKLCRNFIPLTEGSLKRRGGSRFVAQTPEVSAVTFSVQAKPIDAKILINNLEQNSLDVAVGDTVSYEVSAKGYETISGQVVVGRNTTIEVALISLTERCKLTVEALPYGATVKIAGYERNVYDAVKGEKVPVTVFCDNCTPKSEIFTLDTGLQYTVILMPESDDNCNYGDWGVPLCFVCCSAYGKKMPQKKCFLIRFTHGYLPVIFDADAEGPNDDDVDESLFIYDENDGYNALYCDDNGENHLAVIQRSGELIYYENRDGDILAAFDIGKKNDSICWQTDEENKPAIVYKFYDGYLVNKTVKVQLNGKAVWSMKGRKNG